MGRRRLHALAGFPAAGRDSGADNAKWFVCKYVGTPGETSDPDGWEPDLGQRERHPSIRSQSAPFSDAGRHVLVKDTGQDEPDPSLCPQDNPTSIDGHSCVPRRLDSTFTPT
jgi:hypothetical protein